MIEEDEEEKRRITDPVEISRAEGESGIDLRDEGIESVEQRAVGNVDQTLNEGSDRLRVLSKGRGPRTPLGRRGRRSESQPREVQEDLLCPRTVLVGKIEEIDQQANVVQSEVSTGVTFHPMDSTRRRCLQRHCARRGKRNDRLAQRLLRIFIDRQRGKGRSGTHLFSSLVEGRSALVEFGQPVENGLFQGLRGLIERKGRGIVVDLFGREIQRLEPLTESVEGNEVQLQLTIGIDQHPRETRGKTRRTAGERTQTQTTRIVIIGVQVLPDRHLTMNDFIHPRQMRRGQTTRDDLRARPEDLDRLTKTTADRLKVQRLLQRRFGHLRTIL